MHLEGVVKSNNASDSFKPINEIKEEIFTFNDSLKLADEPT